MLLVHHVGERLHLPAIREIERETAFEIGRRDELALSQSLQRGCFVPRLDAESEAGTTRSTPRIERQHQSGQIRRTTVMDRTHAEGTRETVKSRHEPLGYGKFRVPDQRAVPKTHIEVVVSGRSMPQPISPDTTSERSRRMRILIALVLIAAVGWSGYWFYGARSLHRAIRAEIAELRSDGISVETDDISVTGFPNQFDTTFTTPRLAWPSGVVWSAPFLQIFALSYRPNQIIVALPPRQSLSGPFGEAVIENGRARASGLFRTDGQLTLDHAESRGRRRAGHDRKPGRRGREAAGGRARPGRRETDPAEHRSDGR